MIIRNPLCTEIYKIFSVTAGEVVTILIIIIINYISR